VKKTIGPISSTISKLLGLSIAAAMLPMSVSALAADTNSYTIETIEYEDVDDEDAAPSAFESDAVRSANAIAQFGPFSVIDAQTVEMNGTIDSTTPGVFRRMIAAYPDVRTIRMLECPGSVDDDANLSLSRMVRRAGINTHVPRGGSIRSGGVEFFLAGVKRTVEPGAEFGVHSWQDEDGREATEYAPTDPVHSAYINFYVDMGLNRETARSFYNFTNAAAPADGVYYMKPTELARYQITN
jgi:hypothetical protein